MATRILGLAKYHFTPVVEAHCLGYAQPDHGPGQSKQAPHVSICVPGDMAWANPEDTDDDPWYIVSNEPTDSSTLDEYGLRFDIEENFLDDKSNGFQVESSRLDNAPAMERLFLILAIATLHFTSVGVGVVARKTRRWVDTHWDRGMSYLKIGWKWLRQQFRKQWSVLPSFWLDPAPDPQPAIASRRQAARRPKRHWQVSYFNSVI